MRILPYTDALAPMFRSINEAWIADMFVLEPHDDHVLSHLRECIVDPGGTIFFAATDDGTLVGTGVLSRPMRARRNSPRWASSPALAALGRAGRCSPR